MNERCEDVFDIPLGYTVVDIRGVLYIMIGWKENTNGKVPVFHMVINGPYNAYAYSCAYAETLVAKFPDIERLRK